MASSAEASLWSFGSVGSILSIGPAGSILSIGSAGSILSIGSMGSIVALGRALAAPGRPGLTSAELGTLLSGRRRPADARRGAPPTLGLLPQRGSQALVRYTTSGRGPRSRHTA
jgi:hypothetical protein